MVLYCLLLVPFLYLWYSTIFYWFPAYPYGTLPSSTAPLSIPMVLYYLLLALCQYILYSSIFYQLLVYPYDTILSSTGPLPIPMLLYYLLLTPCLSYGTLLPSTVPLPISLVLYYLLLTPCLFLWYTIIFYFVPAYTCIPMVSYYLLLTHFLYLRYSITFHWPTAYPSGTLLPSAGPCLSLWYYTIFYWLPVYSYVWYSTIFYWLSSNTYATLLSSTGPLPITIVLYYLHLALPFVPSIPVVLYCIHEAGRL